MTFTAAEKLQIAMLADLGKPAESRELDFEFIRDAVANGDGWALHWQYPGLELDFPTPPEVLQVCDLLDMWDRIEENFEALEATEKVRVQEESYSSHPPRFFGFDGNNEGDQMHIADLLLNKLGRWRRFKDRELNSHFPTADINERLLAVWKPLWDQKVKRGGNYEFSADELIKILRECVHPSHRQYDPDGTWTYSR